MAHPAVPGDRNRVARRRSTPCRSTGRIPCTSFDTAEQHIDRRCSTLPERTIFRIFRNSGDHSGGSRNGPHNNHAPLHMRGCKRCFHRLLLRRCCPRWNRPLRKSRPFQNHRRLNRHRSAVGSCSSCLRTQQRRSRSCPRRFSRPCSKSTPSCCVVSPNLCQIVPTTARASWLSTLSAENAMRHVDCSTLAVLGWCSRCAPPPSKATER